MAHPDLFFASGKPAVQQCKLFATWCDIGTAKFGSAGAALTATDASARKTAAAAVFPENREKIIIGSLPKGAKM